MKTDTDISQEKRYDKSMLLMRAAKLFYISVILAASSLCLHVFYGEIAGALGPFAIWLFIVFHAVVSILLYRVYNAFEVGYFRIGAVVYALSLANCLSAFFVYVMICLAQAKFSNPLPMIVLVVLQILFSLLWSHFSTKLYRKLNCAKRTVIVYREKRDLDRLCELESYCHQFDVLKYIEDPKDDIDMLIEQLRDFEAVFVIGIDTALRNEIAKYCVKENLIGFFAPYVGDILMMGSRYMQAFHFPITCVQRRSLSIEYLAIKRLMDIVVSSIALILTGPLMVVVAVLIKLYDGGPVLYKQVRLTKNAKRFEILKFRSMRTDAEKDGIARLSAENDDRITPIGKIIRTYRIDELPQLINILKGDMSLVGPRPERPEIAEQYEKDIPDFALRLQVKAGLTGFAQIFGRYNTEPYDKLEMDLYYINRMSILEDIRLIFATVKILFMKESTAGIQNGQCTAARNEANATGEEASELINV